MKRILSILLIIASISCIYANVFAANTEAADMLSTLTEYGIMVGDENGDLSLYNQITRAEMAAMIYRISGQPVQSNDTEDIIGFSDVPDDFWAAPYIKVLCGKKIINGFGDGTFKPNDFVTYEQMAAMAVRALGYTLFADNLGGYPEGYITVCLDLGLFENMVFAANQFVTREAVADILYNALDVPIAVQYGFENEVKIMNGVYDDTPLKTWRMHFE